MTTNLRAALTVCDYANSPDEARELLDMLGLISGGNITDDFTRVIELDRPDAKGPGARSEYNLHETGDARSARSTAPPALRNMPVAAWKPAPRRRTAAQNAGPPQHLNEARKKPCGTTAAYRRHLRNGEPVCEPCQIARRENDKREAKRRRPECGTVQAYRSHNWHQEKPCQPCKDAEAARARAKTRERAESEGRIVPLIGPAKCGTLSGEKRHRRVGEPVCEECREAQRVYRRERRALKVKPEQRSDQHGTLTAHRAHYRRGEKPCDICVATYAEAQRNRRRGRSKTAA